MSESPLRSGPHPRRLDETQMSTWLPFVRLLELLPQALDRKLRETVGINHAHYAILVTLARHPERRLLMGDLAQQSASSPSRLTHSISALEAKGWVRRAPCSFDRRAQYAELTEDGLQMLRTAAPVHVAQVRELVFAQLDEEEAEQLGHLARKLLLGIEGSDAGTPPRKKALAGAD